MNPPDPTRPFEDPTRRLAPGSLLAGRYRIGDLRGVGGMGIVYRAHDQELDIDVAVKIIRPELALDASLIDRFRRELILGRQVSHPNVVRIHDIGQDGDLYFLTMDFIDGRSLRDWMQEHHPADEASVVALLRPLAEALAAAHRAGVIHRDLKPANILLDSAERPHISDFGLARSLATPGPTQTGVVMGTPDYLSPEQARGEAVDARSDLYALGIIAFELLAGQLPFPGGSFAETVAQRIAGRPRSLAEAGAHVSPKLTAIVRRCLEPSPAKRFDSADDLLRALDAHEPRGRRWWPAAAAATIGIVALAFTARALVPRRPKVHASVASVAVLPLRDETGSPSLAWMATGVPEMLTEALAQSPDLRVVDAGHAARTLEDLKLDTGSWTDETLKRVGDLLDAEVLLVGSARARGEVLRVDAQLVRVGGAGGNTARIEEEAQTPGALVAAIGRDIRSRLDVSAPDVAVPLSESPEALAAFHRGSELLARGDAVLAEPELERAVAADPAFGGAWTKLAEACASNGKRERALEAIDRAVKALGGGEGRLASLALARKAGLEGDPERAGQLLSKLAENFPDDLETAVALADAYAQSGRLNDAQHVMQRVVAKSPNHPRGWFLLGKYAILGGDSRKAVDEYLARALVVQNNLRSDEGRADVENAFGVAYRELGDLEHAQERYREAADLRRRIGDRRGYATTLRNIAQVETARGQFDGAGKTLAAAVGIFEEIGDSAGRADAINEIGVMEEARGDYRKALDRYREALQIRHALGDRRAEAESLNNVGYANQLLGDLENASVYWHQAIDLYRQTGNREGEILVTQSLGQLEIAQGRWDEATKSYLDALQKSRENEMAPLTAASLGYLGRLAQYQGRYAAALSSYDDGLKILDGLKDAHGLVEFTLDRAETWIELGSPDDAKADLARVEAWLAAASNHEQSAEWLRLTARLEAGRGDAAAARATLVRARREAEASESAAVTLRIDVDQGLQLLAEGRGPEALRALQADFDRAERIGDAALRLHAGEALARASLHARDLERADRLLAQTLRLAGSCGTYAGAVRLYRLQALASRARGDARAERVSLDQASGELKRLQQGLDPHRASGLERTLAAERS